MNVQKTRDYLKSIEKQSLAALKRLVGVNSYTHNGKGVDTNGKIIEHLFKGLGFKARRVKSVHPDAGHHLFMTKKGKGKKNLIMVSHMDTVFAPEVEKSGRFKWREQGDRIFGPGTIDMKGGTIVMLMVLKALKKRNPDLFNRLTFHLLFNATEETSSRDFPGLARKYADKNSLACLVYEQGRIIGSRNKTGIIVSRRGSARFRIEVTGRAAHSGAGHHMGINAIRELARIIERVESMTDYKRGLTFNAGVVQGGQVVNTVPPYAVCLVDMRTSNPADFRRGIRRILSLSGPGSFKNPYDGRRARVRVSLLPEFIPWPETPKNRRLARLFLDCANRLKQPLGTYTAGASSDGNFFHDIVPTLDGLGPVGANSHCAVHAPARGRMQEHAFRSSFVRRALLSVMAVEALARGYFKRVACR